MKDVMQSAADIAQQAPGIKMAATAVGAGSATTAFSASPDWTVYAGLGLTTLGLMVAIGSLWIGYLNFQERKRENDRKEREANGC